MVAENATQVKELNSQIMPSVPEKQSPLVANSTEAPGLAPSGLAPSDEMRLLHEARESARAAAEASGSGRRPRVPSRKLLEASGKLMCDSVQWMTKEKKEEEARFKLVMKEHRRAAAAAGLKFGHRMEAVVVSPPVGATAEGGGIEISSGETASAGARADIKAAVSGVVRRKLTPKETSLVAGKQPPVDKPRPDLPDNKATTTETPEVAAAGTGKNGQSASATPDVAARAYLSKRKRKVMGSAGGSVTQIEGARKSKHRRPSRRTVEGGDTGPIE